MSDGKFKIHVGDSLDQIGARVIDAWHRMERGEDVNERHVGFDTLETMTRVLTPKRIQLLRHLHRHPVPHIRALATALGRDYRRVHEDVEVLEDAGLLDRDKNGLRADYDVFDVRVVEAL